MKCAIPSSSAPAPPEEPIATPPTFWREPKFTTHPHTSRKHLTPANGWRRLRTSPQCTPDAHTHVVCMQLPLFLFTLLSLSPSLMHFHSHTHSPSKHKAVCLRSSPGVQFCFSLFFLNHCFLFAFSLLLPQPTWLTPLSLLPAASPLRSVLAVSVSPSAARQWAD